MACTTTTTKKPACSFVQIWYPMNYLPFIYNPTGVHFKLEDSVKCVSHPTLAFVINN